MNNPLNKPPKVITFHIVKYVEKDGEMVKDDTFTPQERVTNTDNLSTDFPKYIEEVTRMTQRAKFLSDSPIPCQYRLIESKESE